MRILVVSGIWPPDVGGPASHAPEAAVHLRAAGHEVDVVTTADAAPAAEPYPVAWTPRRLPPGVRHLHGAVLVARRARRADVVYSTGMLGRTTAGALAARTPYVAKLTGDPAFDRARWRGIVGGSVDEFQHARGPRIGVLRFARDLELRRAAHVLCPSEFLRRLAIGWGVPPDRVSVLPNAVPDAELAPREELRRRFGIEGPTLAFAGRLTAPKALDVALEAVARVEGVMLLLAGDGEERGELERRAHELRLNGRVRFLGAQPRTRVLELFRAADAALLSSRWENFPHSLVEALAVGTPAVATAVGGIEEIVTDGENGVLAPPGDSEALARAIERCLADTTLRDRASASVDRFRPERVYARLEEVLREAAGS